MSDETLSVILPNYNHARYLRDSLTAIVTQSFKPKEVIVIDDSSTDDSVAVIESFTRGHPFVQLLRNSHNRGAIECNRIGLERASGDYVAFEAADDKILPGLYEKSMALLRRYPQAGLCSALAKLLGPDGEDLGDYDTPVISGQECFIPPQRYLPTYKEFDNWIVAYTVILRRSSVLETGGVDPTLGPLADSVMNREIAIRHGACFIPQPLAAWRRVEGGFGYAFSQDVAKVLALWDYVDKRVQSPAGGGPPLPEELEYVRLWRRRIIAQYIYELNERNPRSYDQIRLVGRRLPSPGLIDRAYLAGLPLFSRWGRFPTKLYHFSRQAPAERRRILRHKLRSLLGERT